jgi:hypothetical protein
MDNRELTVQPIPSPNEHRPAPQLPRYTPPCITSYTDAEILAALGPAQTGGYAGTSGMTSWF